MSRRKYAITQEQDHLLHIFILAGFLIALILAEASNAINNHRFVLFASVAYIIVNVYVDYKAGELKADMVLQYCAIALLSTLVATSF